MTEFMEERLHLAEREQGRLRSRGFREIGHHAHMGSDVLAFPRDPLALELGHPGTILLAFARIEVSIEHGEVTAILVKHFISLHVRVIDLYILILLERYAIELVGQSEDALNDVVELEIRAEHLCVEVVFLHLQLMRIIGEIPWLQFKVVAFELLCLVLNSLYFFNGRGLVSINEIVEQLIHILDIAGHAMLEHIVGKRVITEELSYLPSQVHDALADVEVVGIVVVGTLRAACHIELFAEVSLRGVSHERRIARIVEREDPSFEPPVLSSLCGGIDSCLRQSVELRLVRDMKRKGFVFLQQVL